MRTGRGLTRPALFGRSRSYATSSSTGAFAAARDALVAMVNPRRVDSSYCWWSPYVAKIASSTKPQS